VFDVLGTVNVVGPVYDAGFDVIVIVKVVGFVGPVLLRMTIGIRPVALQFNDLMT
jgi:hypothetical protein